MRYRNKSLRHLTVEQLERMIAVNRGSHDKDCQNLVRLCQRELENRKKPVIIESTVLDSHFRQRSRK